MAIETATQNIENRLRNSAVENGSKVDLFSGTLAAILSDADAESNGCPSIAKISTPADAEPYSRARSVWEERRISV